MQKESTIILFGNRLAKRCQAMSKQRGRQCRNSVARGGSGRVCRFHGHGGGPKSSEGRRLCAAANTVHGRETREKREARAKNLAELRVLEQQMYKLGMLKKKDALGRKTGAG